MFSTPAGSEGMSSFQRVRWPVCSIEAVDAGGQLTGLIDVERVAIGAEGDGLLAGIESGNRAADRRRRLGYIYPFLSGPMAAICCESGEIDKRSAVYAFRGNRLALAGGQIVDVEAHALAGFVGGK